MFINARDNETMPVMNDEVPDEGDYDAGRGRGEFDNITPEDFIHGGGSGHGNPPGWLGPSDINRARHQMPIAYVEIVPVRTDEMGRISQVGSLLRVSEDGSIERTLITGRVLYHETLREAIARNVAKDLGDIALPLLPIGLQPFTVAEFFPTPGLSEYYDPRQHAIALCYVVPIAGDCKPQDETLDVEWVDPKSDVMDTFVAQMVNGHGRIVRQGVKVKFADFQQTTVERTSSRLDTGLFLSLLREAWARGEGKPVRLLGVVVSLPQPSETVETLQLSLAF